MLIDGPQQGGGGGGFLDSLGSLAGGIGRGISSGASAVADGLGFGGFGGGGMGPFFNPTPDIGPLFDDWSLPSLDDWGGGGGGGGGPFFNPTPELEIPTGLIDDRYDNPWMM